jgi:hypothetical protein
MFKDFSDEPAQQPQPKGKRRPARKPVPLTEEERSAIRILASVKRGTSVAVLDGYCYALKTVQPKKPTMNRRWECCENGCRETLHSHPATPLDIAWRMGVTSHSHPADLGRVAMLERHAQMAAVENGRPEQQMEGEPRSVPCLGAQCGCCRHMSGKGTVGEGRPGGPFRIDRSYDCTSKQVVYCLECQVTKRFYVGQTMASMRRRLRAHRKQVNKVTRGRDAGIKNFEMYKHFAAVGLSNVKITVLDRADDLDTLLSLERKWIRKLGSLAPGGFNLLAGEGPLHASESEADTDSEDNPKPLAAESSFDHGEPSSSGVVAAGGRGRTRKARPQSVHSDDSWDSDREDEKTNVSKPKKRDKKKDKRARFDDSDSDFV